MCSKRTALLPRSRSRASELLRSLLRWPIATSRLLRQPSINIAAMADPHDTDDSGRRRVKLVYDSIISDADSQKSRMPTHYLGIRRSRIRAEVVNTRNYSLLDVLLQVAQRLGGGRADPDLMRHGKAL